MIVRKQDAQHIEFEGLGILDYTSSLEDNAASMALIDVPPGVAHAKSWSKRSDKYYLVVDGGIRFTLEGDEFGLATGDFCLVRQGQVFSYRNVATEPSRLVLVHTPPFAPESEVMEE